MLFLSLMYVAVLFFMYCYCLVWLCDDVCKGYCWWCKVNGKKMTAGNNKQTNYSMDNSMHLDTHLINLYLYFIFQKQVEIFFRQRNRNRMHYQPSSLPDPAFTAPRLSHYGLTPGLYALRGKYCPLPDIKHYCTQYPSAPISLCYINIWDFSQYYPITPMWSMG